MSVGSCGYLLPVSNVFDAQFYKGHIYHLSKDEVWSSYMDFFIAAVEN